MAAPSPVSPRPHISNSNHIDLTLDDDDDNVHYQPQRQAKRPRTDIRHDFTTPSPFTSSSSFAMTTSMSPFPIIRPSPSPAQSSSQFSSSPFSQFPNYVPPSNQSTYRPPFAGPPPFLAGGSHSSPSISHRNSSNQFAPPQHPQASSAVEHRQVIDLTGSPSPPPPTMPRQPSQPPLPADLPPKTPVCIGQLTVTALVLYPVAYLSPQNPGETEWAYVRLQYEHNPNKATSKETIHIRTPSTKGPSGENVPGEIFGVVEQKVADLLGPMLGKGLIRLDAKIRKGTGNV